MNRDLKYWKEAATVILTASIRMHNLSKSATNMQTCQHPQGRNLPHECFEKTGYNYALLMVQRNTRSNFFPSAYVFPGGWISSSDFSNEWIQLFHPFCQPPNFKLDTVKQTARRSPIFATDRRRLGSQIPAEVAFRICAIRETFEETGVLLVKPNHPDKELNNCGVIELPQYNQNKLANWRPLVLENASNFIKLCKELDCLPNIWALKEWSNWLTPTFQRRRFDTAFFICCLEEIPFTVHDGREIISHSWMIPIKVIENHQSEKLFIPPPQWYEIGRLCQFNYLKDLQRFSQDRSVEGCERWLPVRSMASDGFATLYPGDELYPENPDLTGETGINLTSSKKSLKEMRLEVTRLHRTECRNPYDCTLYVNIEPRYKHVHPLTIQSSQWL